MELVLAFVAGAIVCGLAAYVKIKNITSKLSQTEMENARLTERLV